MRQTTNFTCGPASIAVIMKAIANAMGTPELSLSEGIISRQMRTRPRKGTSIEDIVEYIENDDLLKGLVESHGTNKYKGGIAIANIRNWRSGGGHFVVMLGEDEKHRFHIYDVIGGQVYKKSRDEFEWCNSSKTLSNWSINFSLSDEVLEKVVELINNIHENIVHIITGRNDEDRSLQDNSRFLKDRYEANNITVNSATDDEIKIIGNTLMLGSAIVIPGDTVWIKIDPNLNNRYYLVLKMLAIFEELGVIFINPPSLILSYDEKIIPLITGNQNNIFAVDDSAIKGSVYYLKSNNLTVKELGHWGGDEVYFVSGDDADEIYKKTKDKKTNDAPYVIERDIRDGADDINSRLIWYKGKLIGTLERERFPEELDRRIHADEFYVGRMRDIESNSELMHDISKISDFLSDKKCILAEISILNHSKITKVVISNPGSIKMYIEYSGNDFLD